MDTAPAYGNGNGEDRGSKTTWDVAVGITFGCSSPHSAQGCPNSHRRGCLTESNQSSAKQRSRAAANQVAARVKYIGSCLPRARDNDLHQDWNPNTSMWCGFNAHKARATISWPVVAYETVRRRVPVPNCDRGAVRELRKQFVPQRPNCRQPDRAPSAPGPVPGLSRWRVDSPVWNAVITPHWARCLAPNPHGPLGLHAFISAPGPARTCRPYLRYPAYFLHLRLLSTLHQVDQKRSQRTRIVFVVVAPPALIRTPASHQEAHKNHGRPRCQNRFSLY
ncbi:hypothetical protein B0T14DRAFT_255909 [Immersiella caudata]|uniref:Uncharacterized protein n=1 Tax=Immersiella caudata TaxID=314043 RepID=A0AA40BXC1_9PEZI|nr:hypothetical protein B0T14DRAFT_255909 [Immersiella caudata]